MHRTACVVAHLIHLTRLADRVRSAYPVSLQTSGPLWSRVSFAAFRARKALHAGEALLAFDAGGPLDPWRTLRAEVNGRSVTNAAQA